MRYIIGNGIAIDMFRVHLPLYNEAAWRLEGRFLYPQYKSFSEYQEAYRQKTGVTMCEECNEKLAKEYEDLANRATLLREALQTLVEDIEYHGHGSELNKHLDLCRALIDRATREE